MEYTLGAFLLTSQQLRAARALVRWDQKQVAHAAGLSVETIKRLEKIDGPLLAVTGATLVKLQAALEAAGIIFLEDSQLVDGGPGVRLRKD